MTQDKLIREARQQALLYVLSRRMQNGGFCYFRAWGAGASSVVDTHAAILSLFILDSPFFLEPGEAGLTKSWLGESLRRELSFNDVIGVWHLAASFKLLGESFPGEEAPTVCSFLKRTMGHFPLDPGKRRSKEKRPGSFKSRVAWNRLADLALWQDARIDPVFFDIPEERTLLDHFFTWEYHLSGWKTKSGYDRTHEIRDFSEFSHDLFGFVLAKGSTATDIGVIAAGVFAQTQKGLPLENTTAILDGILDSQSRSGGFGRIPGAVPDLVSTADALLTLEMLFPEKGNPSHLSPAGLWWSLF